MSSPLRITFGLCLCASHPSVHQCLSICRHTCPESLEHRAEDVLKKVTQAHLCCSAGCLLSGIPTTTLWIGLSFGKKQEKCGIKAFFHHVQQFLEWLTRLLLRVPRCKGVAQSDWSVVCTMNKFGMSIQSKRSRKNGFTQDWLWIYVSESVLTLVCNWVAYTL